MTVSFVTECHTTVPTETTVAQAAIKYCYDDALIAGNKKIGMYPRFINEGGKWRFAAEYILVSEITLINK